MKKPISLLAVASAFFSAQAHAAVGDAKDKKCDERKALMKQCPSKNLPVLSTDKVLSGKACLTAENKTRV